MSGNPPLIWHHADLDLRLFENDPSELGSRDNPSWLKDGEPKRKIHKPEIEPLISGPPIEFQEGSTYGKHLVWITHPLLFRSETQGVHDLAFKMIGSLSTTPDGSLALMTARRIILISQEETPYVPKIELVLEGLTIPMTVQKTSYSNVLTLDYPAGTKPTAARARRCEMVLSNPWNETFRLDNLFLRQSASTSKHLFTEVPQSPTLESSLMDTEESYFGAKELIQSRLHKNQESRCNSWKPDKDRGHQYGVRSS